MPNARLFTSVRRSAGYWSRLNLFGSNPAAGSSITTLPQRVLWAQEPAMVMLKKSGTTGDLLDLVVNRQMTMRYVDEASPRIQVGPEFQRWK